MKRLFIALLYFSLILIEKKSDYQITLESVSGINQY